MAGSVTLVSQGGMLQSFSEEGKFLWSYALRGRVKGSLSRSPEGTSYVFRSNGALMAINRAGRQIWELNLGRSPRYPHLVGWDGRLFVITDTHLFCFTASGNRLWRIALEAPPVLEPQLSRSGGVLAALDNQTLIEVSPFSRVEKRRLGENAAAFCELRSPRGSPLKSALGASIPEETRPILVLYRGGSSEIHLGGSDYPIPLVSLGARPLGAVSRGRDAAVALGNGKMRFFSGEKGTYDWSADVPITETTSADDTRMIWEERGIYLLSRGGAAGIDTDGKRIWFFNLMGAAGVPAFSRSGILYSGGQDWILYAYKLEDRVLREKTGLYGAMGGEQYFPRGDPRPSSWAEDPLRFSEDNLRTELEKIRRAIERGAVGNQEGEYLAYLMEVAGSLGLVRGGAGTRIPLPVPLRYRAEAARLMGYLGSRDSISFLANLYRTDQEPLVKTAAASAMGHIGVDPQGLALRAFSALVFPPKPYNDEQVLFATAVATGALCRFSGPPLSERGIELLVALGGDNRPPLVRNKAREELARLR